MTYMEMGSLHETVTLRYGDLEWLWIDPFIGVIRGEAFLLRY
jgi:hypothetical protein